MKATLDKISFWALCVSVALLPLFFLPFSKVPIETSKGIVFVLGLGISIIFWAAARFSEGKIRLPRSPILAGGLIMALAFFLSALFSTSKGASFFGLMFDLGSFWFIFSCFLAMLFTSIIVNDSVKRRVLLLGVILSSLIVIIFQIIRTINPAALGFGVLAEKTSNLVGSWNTLGIFIGLATIFALFIFEFFPLSKMFRWLTVAVVALALFLLGAINFHLVWILLGIFTLIIFVYKISLSFNMGGGEKTNTFPTLSFVVIILALLFSMSGQFVGGYIPGKLKISTTEISPSFSATMGIAGKVIKKDPIFGLGPNRFPEAWAINKDASINTTQFWDASFNSGSGVLPTFFATTGLVGTLSILLFFFLFVITGAKTIFSSIKKGMNTEAAMFFFAALYLFISTFFYPAGMVILVLFFVLTGVFISVASLSRPNGEIVISFLQDSRKSFFSVLLLVLLIIVSAGLLFKYSERFASVSYFGKALTSQDLAVAEASINRAVSLYPNDLYLRAYAQTYLLKLNTLAAKGESLTDAEKNQLQQTLNLAEQSAKLAVMYNKDNYLNYQMLGSIYYTVGALGVSGAYEQAFQAYKSASDLNPLNPGTKLDLANSSFFLGKVEEAKTLANEALTLKADYPEAYIVLSQIATKEGKRAEGISFAEKALALSPGNKDLINYVESLKNPGGATLPKEGN